LDHFAVDVKGQELSTFFEKLAGKISIFSWCNNYKPNKTAQGLEISIFYYRNNMDFY